MNIHKGTIKDTDALVQIELAARQAVYAGILHQDDLNSLTESKAKRHWKHTFIEENPWLFVAENDVDRIMGYIWCGQSGDEDLGIIPPR